MNLNIYIWRGIYNENGVPGNVIAIFPNEYDARNFVIKEYRLTESLGSPDQVYPVGTGMSFMFYND